MSVILAIIENEPVTLHEDGSVTFRAKFAVDTDGCGPLHGDPDAQSDTSLHLDGKPLNADVDRYVVVPPAILNGVAPIVLGCQAFAHNIKTGLTSRAVVGDIGPHKKLGEGSVALARALGIDPSPTQGGTEEHIVEWRLLPGVPAAVEGKVYKLQSAR